MKQKIILFAVLPLLLALCVIALTVRHHAMSLAQQIREVIKPAYLATKEAELKNYVAIARHAISHLYESGEKDEKTKEKARKILERMEYGEDGYFFIYDFQGRLQMHPKISNSVGKEMLEEKDKNGKPIIRDLIDIATGKKDLEFYDYVWPKYSQGIETKPLPKRAYVIGLPDWEWMLGTGVYLDDVDNALAKIDAQVSRNIDNTMLWIAGIAFFAAVIIFLGLLRNIRERTVLDDRLSEVNNQLGEANNQLGEANNRLTVANNQLEEANARLSETNIQLEEANTNLATWTQRLITARKEEKDRLNYLHDGIQSMLTSIKMNIEVAITSLSKNSRLSPEFAPFKSAAKAVGGVLTDLRKIIDGLAISDPQLPLATQLDRLTLDMSNLEMPINFIEKGEIKDLTLDTKEALFMTAKPALENVIKYAHAHQVSVRLEGTSSCVKLEICDDGIGFDDSRISNELNSGIGLRSMRERLKTVGGELSIISSSRGTRLVATVPYR
jgi:two-component system NarL family sensor kinase